MWQLIRRCSIKWNRSSSAMFIGSVLLRRKRWNIDLLDMTIRFGMFVQTSSLLSRWRRVVNGKSWPRGCGKRRAQVTTKSPTSSHQQPSIQDTLYWHTCPARRRVLRCSLWNQKVCDFVSTSSPHLTAWSGGLRTITMKLWVFIVLFLYLSPLISPMPTTSSLPLLILSGFWVLMLIYLRAFPFIHTFLSGVLKLFEGILQSDLWTHWMSVTFGIVCLIIWRASYASLVYLPAVHDWLGLSIASTLRSSSE